MSSSSDFYLCPATFVDEAIVELGTLWGNRKCTDHVDSHKADGRMEAPDPRTPHAPQIQIVLYVDEVQTLFCLFGCHGQILMFTSNGKSIRRVIID